MEEKTKAWTIFWILWTKTLGDLTRCHTLISCTLLLIYMTFELSIKCQWQHPATSNHLEITKIGWREASDTNVITAHSLRQLQPGTWKIPIKPGTDEQNKSPLSPTRFYEISTFQKHSSSDQILS